MDDKWERGFSFLSLDIKTIQKLVDKYNTSLIVESIEPIVEGKRSTIYKLNISDNDSMILRIFAPNSDYWKKEKLLCDNLLSHVSLQEIFYIGTDSCIDDRYYGLYSYENGISMMEYFTTGNVISDSLIIQVAEYLGKFHSIKKFDKLGFFEESFNISMELPHTKEWFGMFLGENAKSKLGYDRVEKLDKILSNSLDILDVIESDYRLVHGDFRPTNIIVKDGEFSSVIDWEYSMAGHPLSDIGQLFRREEYFSESQKRLFIEKYKAVSSYIVPENWYKIAKLRDLVNLFQMLNTNSSQPKKQEDLLELIDKTIKIFNK